MRLILRQLFPTIIDELNAAGLQTVIDEAQKQLDALLNNDSVIIKKDPPGFPGGSFP